MFAEHREFARQIVKMATLSAAVTGSSDAIAEMDVVNPLTSTGNLVAKQFLEDNPDIAKKMASSMGLLKLKRAMNFTLLIVYCLI